MGVVSEAGSLAPKLTHVGLFSSVSVFLWCLIALGNAVQSLKLSPSILRLGYTSSGSVIGPGPAIPEPRYDRGCSLNGNILIGRKEHWTESLLLGGVRCRLGQGQAMQP